ncbi:MAG: tetratricopeptide repeat protein [Pseudomonadota bacterium]
MMRIPAAVVALVAILGLSGAIARADQSDDRLEALFNQLLTSETFAQAQATEFQIWRIWSSSEDDAVTLLMKEGSEAMAVSDYPRALRYFDQITAIAPDFAEGWNKRATVHYLMSNYQASLEDIDKTLALEPRHFGALSGRGLIYIQLKSLEDALKSFEEAIEIHPTMPGPRVNAEAIRQILKESEI